MDERRVVFADWVDQPVEVTRDNPWPPTFGVLEEVNDWGLVLRYRRTFPPQPTGESDDMGDLVTEPEVKRVVYEFWPLHIVVGVRTLEREELETHKL